MIYPNKSIKIEESIIFKTTFILELKTKHSEIGITEGWKLLNKKFNNLDEYIYALDILYVLNKVEIDFENKTIIYAKGN